MNYQEVLIEFKKKREIVYQDHLTGMSYNQLAKKYNVSVSRISRIIAKERKPVVLPPTTLETTSVPLTP